MRNPEEFHGERSNEHHHHHYHHGSQGHHVGHQTGHDMGYHHVAEPVNFYPMGYHVSHHNQMGYHQLGGFNRL